MFGKLCVVRGAKGVVGLDVFLDGLTTGRDEVSDGGLGEHHGRLGDHHIPRPGSFLKLLTNNALV